MAQFRAEAQSRAREIDLLRFGLDEIERIAPVSGEDVALAAEALRLQSADDLRDSAQSAVQALAGPDDEAGGALAMLYAARKVFESAVSRDPAATQLGERLAEASYQLTDLTADLARYLDSLESQPGRLEQIAERRAQLSTLTRKYGTTCDEVLQWAAESAVRLTQLEQSDERIATLERAGRCARDGARVFGWPDQQRRGARRRADSASWCSVSLPPSRCRTPG